MDELATRLIGVLWLATVVYLTVSAASAKRDTETHYAQSLGLLTVLVAAFALPRLPPFAFLDLGPRGALLDVIGVALTAAGLAVLVWARRTLGRNWSQTVAAKSEHERELVAEGPYRLVRHPMYAGGFVAAVGSALVTGGPFLLLLVMLGALFLWRVGAEDALLAREFPATFPAYRRRTKRLIPFVW